MVSAVLVAAKKTKGSVEDVLNLMDNVKNGQNPVAVLYTNVHKNIVLAFAVYAPISRVIG